MARISKTDEAFEAAEKAQFAADVRALYRATIAGKDAAEFGPHVRQVAFGLVALRQALDHFLHLHRNNPLRLTEAGAYEADDILAALTTGSAHPIWKYLESFRGTGDLRSRPAPGERERTIRSMMAGAVLAYERTGTTRKAAAEAISGGIWTADRSFKPAQLLQWIRRSDDDGKAAKWFAGQFTADTVMVPDCDSPAERVLIVVRKAVHPLLAVPA